MDEASASTVWAAPSSSAAIRASTVVPSVVGSAWTVANRVLNALTTWAPGSSAARRSAPDGPPAVLSPE